MMYHLTSLLNHPNLIYILKQSIKSILEKSIDFFKNKETLQHIVPTKMP